MTKTIRERMYSAEAQELQDDFNADVDLRYRNSGDREMFECLIRSALQEMTFGNDRKVLIETDSERQFGGEASVYVGSVKEGPCEDQVTFEDEVTVEMMDIIRFSA